MKSTHTITILALGLMGACMIYAAESKSSLNAADEKFIMKAAMHGKAEVQVAELGVKKATDSEVKAIAELMVKDHTAVNGEITNFAKSKGVELSSAGDPKADATVADLEKLSGKDFDNAFLKHLAKGHKSGIAAYETASKDSTDGDLKAWAGKTLPTLRAHLDRITKALEALVAAK